MALSATPAALESVTLPNGWSHNVCRVVEKLPKNGVDEALDHIERWARVFPHKGTWIGDTFGVPSLAVRIEGTYDEENGWKIFEIEDRPCGLGVTPRINDAFAQRFAALLPRWPLMKWVIDPERNTDDDLWLGPGITVEEALKRDGLLLVRSRPEKTAYHELESRSVSTISREGDKRCLAELGLGTIVRWEPDDEELEGKLTPAVTNASVIKPVQGTRCRNVMVYLNGAVTYKKLAGQKTPFIGDRRLHKSKSDTVTFERLLKEVRSMGEAICQPFHMPMELDHLPNMNAIYRFYFGFDPGTQRYVPLGGVYNASTSLRVHGEEGVVFGPLDF
ncbi:MAG TPA: hypothetical protein VHD38_01465 [Candidatus Paceibacterota bacterium]|nr:hypothetical protein [Candidatus Paceibacterota bacterium]